MAELGFQPVRVALDFDADAELADAGRRPSAAVHHPLQAAARALRQGQRDRRCCCASWRGSGDVEVELRRQRAAAARRRSTRRAPIWPGPSTLPPTTRRGRDPRGRSSSSTATASWTIAADGGGRRRGRRRRAASTSPRCWPRSGDEPPAAEPPPGEPERGRGRAAAAAPAAGRRPHRRRPRPTPAPRRAASAAPPTIRVDLDRVDRLIDLVGELVINQAMLSQRVIEAGLARALGGRHRASTSSSS